MPSGGKNSFRAFHRAKTSSQDTQLNTIGCIFFQKPKDLWHFDRVSAYFSDAFQNCPMHKISPGIFLNRTLDVLETN